MMPRRLYLLAGALALTACEGGKLRDDPDAGLARDPSLAARYSGGVISHREVEREAKRLPPGLKEQFLSPAGQRELVRTMIDKRLLVDEANRRGITRRPELRDQVRELEERLAVQELLAEEERRAPAATEEELRAYYEAHRAELSEAARARVGRVLIRAASPAQRVVAKARVEKIVARIRSGTPLAAVAAEGDGPERVKAGELGWLHAGDGPEASASLQLRKPGDVTMVESPEGWSAIVLLERQEARTPPFEEVKAAVAAKMEPSRQRQQFEALLSRLRAAAGVEVFASH